MNNREKICFENGTLEFWVVDPKLRQVRVATSDGRIMTYRSGQQIPVSVFGAANIAVDSVFS